MVRDELGEARKEIAEMEILLGEAEATAEVEIRHRERMERELADCLERQGIGR